VGSTAIFDGQGGNGAPVDVADGLLTVSPDFGANVFDGTALWLEIEVRNPHDATDTALYELLDPRQAITGAPVALSLRGLRTSDSGNASSPWNIIGGHAENNVTGGAWGATISGGGLAGFPNSVGGNLARMLHEWSFRWRNGGCRP
jgi:hypothetical protein